MPQRPARAKVRAPKPHSAERAHTPQPGLAAIGLSLPVGTMADMDRNNTKDDSIAALASSQHGLITGDQARQVGLSRHQIQRRVETGRWERMHRGVFRIAGTPATWQQSVAGARLGAPPGATASHLSAAALADLGESAPIPPHVTVTPDRSSRLPGVVVHRAPLPASDLTVIQGVPCTTVCRTLVDCAGIVGPRRLQRLVDEALHRRLVVLDQLPAVWAGVRIAPGRAGEPKLRAAVEPWVGPITPGSPGEARLRQRLARCRLPEPELQVVVRDAHGAVIARIDLGWPSYLLGIEYDSSRWHGPSKWEADQRRQHVLEELGWVILRADRSDLEPGAHDLERAVRQALRSQAARLHLPRLV